MHSQEDLKCLCIMRAGIKQAKAPLSPGAQTHNKPLLNKERSAHRRPEYFRKEWKGGGGPGLRLRDSPSRTDLRARGFRLPLCPPKACLWDGREAPR